MEDISYYDTSSKFFWISVGHAGVRRAWEMKHSLESQSLYYTHFLLSTPTACNQVSGSFNCSLLTHSASLISRASYQLQAEQSQESPLVVLLFCLLLNGFLLTTRYTPSNSVLSFPIYMYLLTPCSPPCGEASLWWPYPICRGRNRKVSDLLHIDSSSPYTNSIIKAQYMLKKKIFPQNLPWSFQIRVIKTSV